ncbi:hypothetical protein BDP27DRAFT_1328275 [Rhodocollybia butyracea]|uniref:HNH nuclease domain-containing protein n=1 Tax=Rhodocollybia butyracea TaxID=206335 RepID=A0A9P5PQP2_9AGAR|nr:hypothetical protein BDP27DRAFT_1328275 [Rhodocollybia butyracea]
MDLDEATIKILLETPLHRILARQRPRPATRERVYQATPYGRRCTLTLIELLDGEDYLSDISLAHAIPNGLSEKMVRTLEWFFGLKAGQLNVNSRWNMFLLRMDIHHWFDHLGFILLVMNVEVRDAIGELVRHNEACTNEPGSPARKTWDEYEILAQGNYEYAVYELHLQKREFERVVLDGVNGDTGERTRHQSPFRDEILRHLKTHLRPLNVMAHARLQFNDAIKKGVIDAEGLWIKKEQDEQIQDALLDVWEMTDRWFDTNSVPQSFLREKPVRRKTHRKTRVTTPTPRPKGTGSSRSVAVTVSEASATSSEATPPPNIPMTALYHKITIPTTSVFTLTPDCLKKLIKLGLPGVHPDNITVEPFPDPDDTGVGNRTRSRTHGSSSRGASATGRHTGQEHTSRKSTSRASVPLAKKPKHHSGASSVVSSQRHSGKAPDAPLPSASTSQKREHPASSSESDDPLRLRSSPIPTASTSVSQDVESASD